MWTTADIEANHTFTVTRHDRGIAFLARVCSLTIAKFEDLDEATAFVGNLEDFRGDELSIRDENDECHFAAEWDEDLGRYLN